MASRKNYSPRTSSFGKKRDFILNEKDIDFVSPMKKRSMAFSPQGSLLEALHQDILVKVLCGVEHDDLKKLFHVSKQIREAAMIAKELHFAYTTPKKVPALLDVDDEIEAPNAPRKSRVARSRLNKESLADHSVVLFRDEE